MPDIAIHWHVFYDLRIKTLTFFLLRWHPLKCKPGKNKTEYRGELEVNKFINNFRIRYGQFGPYLSSFFGVVTMTINIYLTR